MAVQMIITLQTDEGQVLYSKGARLSPQLLTKLQKGCESNAVRRGLLIDNPAFDAQQPESDTNRSKINPTGAQAVTLSIRDYLESLAIVEESNVSQSTVTAAVDALKTDIETVTLFDPVV